MSDDLENTLSESDKQNVKKKLNFLLKLENTDLYFNTHQVLQNLHK